jgi:hypothetical protein
VRVLSAVALTPVIGVWAVYLSDPLDWAAALGLLAAVYYVKRKIE